MRKERKVDLIIIGSGTSGLAAAVFAALRGLSPMLIGGEGESDFTSGLIDLMGVHPVEKGLRWNDPWKALEELRTSEPLHPYALLDLSLIRKALDRFIDFVSETGLTYRRHPELNVTVPTSMGTLKTTYGVPSGMWAGTGVKGGEAPVLIVDFEGLKGFSASQISSVLGARRPGLRAVRVPNPLDGSQRELFPRMLAAGLDRPEVCHRLAGLIRPHLADASSVGLPPVLGLYRHREIVRELSLELGTKVFEIPGTIPSIPALRLRSAITRRLARMGVQIPSYKHVMKAEISDPGEIILSMGEKTSRTTIISRGVILATGRFLGGGLYSDHSRIREKIFDLPVTQPSTRELWHRKDFMDSRGHALNRAGIMVDRDMRPLNDQSRPLHEGLFAAGALLAHQDWKRQKCGAGLAIATAFKAVDSFCGRQYPEKEIKRENLSCGTH